MMRTRCNARVEEQVVGAAEEVRHDLLEDQRVAILTSNGTTPPERAYLTEPVAQDAALDLTGLRIVASISDEGISTTVTPTTPFSSLPGSSVELSSDGV